MSGAGAASAAAAAAAASATVAAPAASATSAATAAAAAAAPTIPPASRAAFAAAQERVRVALNQRYMLNRGVEREGLRRSVAGVLIYIAYKFVKHRINGAGAPSPQ